MSIGPGVTAPKPLSTPEPAYSEAARENRIQGTVLLSIIVDQNGRATSITTISPLGYGLDEQAEAAVATWKFVPGMYQGKPVKVIATVEVSFRLLGLAFDDKTERRRTAYNGAVHTVQNANMTPKQVEAAVKILKDLATQEYPPAMYAYGILESQGQQAPKDVNSGVRFIEKAASKTTRRRCTPWRGASLRVRTFGRIQQKVSTR